MSASNTIDTESSLANSLFRGKQTMQYGDCIILQKWLNLSLVLVFIARFDGSYHAMHW